ncbi:hypothetical protein EDB86DRAFT_2830155 [Lactarius hatsudake]|nr:hypothetical protein EDB86DRAFT_2830155 [Lactarius hatsudake]
MRLAKEVSGGAPGSQEFLGALQDATTQLWKDLPIEEQERYAHIAKEWSENALPKGIQAKMASASIHGQILYKTCGVCCIVLIASEKADGTPQVALDEWNSHLDDGQNFTDFFLQWRNTDFWKQWKRYLRMCFATDGDQPAEKDCSKTFKAPIPIITDSNGLPAIPSITRGSISSRAKATIPWAKIAINLTSWIDEECYPSVFPWADPSKQPEQICNRTQRQRDCPSDGDDEAENYSRELARISEHCEDTPTPSLHMSQRMLTTPEPGSIGEASNVSPPSQAPQPVQRNMDTGRGAGGVKATYLLER